MIENEDDYYDLVEIQKLIAERDNNYEQAKLNKKKRQWFEVTILGGLCSLLVLAIVGYYKIEYYKASSIEEEPQAITPVPCNTEDLFMIAKAQSNNRNIHATN